MKKAYIFIEKEVVVDEDADLIEQLIQTINFYFVFNILYPPEICQTLEFLFRFFYKFYPPAVRGAKKHK